MLTIPEYYHGKHIFLTGATGFIGKVFIEKLLRCCPGIEKIYLLMRPKKGQGVQERLDGLLKSKVFDKIRETEPNFESKVIPISGDMMEPNLGISQSDEDMLAENIHIVFHSAATVRFDEQLRVALEMNVIGVRKIITLVRKMKKLEVFLHVSTAYANCDRDNIEEVIYPPPVDPKKLIDAAEWMSDEMLDTLTPQLVGKKPNTYTFTKHLAETILVEEASDLPLCIVRPSIVGASWREPFPGWIDNLNGPGGLYVAAGKGILRSVRGNTDAVADIVPVDIPVNLMIVVAWYTAVVKPKKLLIYHCTTGTLNPYTWGEIEPVVINYFKANPLDNCFRRPKKVTITQSYLHEYWVLVSHLIPAYLTDMGLRCLGKKPRMVRIFNKVHKVCSTLEFFTCRSWKWTHHNLDLLTSQMSVEDKKTFYFDPRGLHWPTYIENYCLGTKTFILNEDLSDMPAARAHLRKLRNIRYIFNTVVIVALWRMLVARSQIARSLWFFVMNLVSKFVRTFYISSTIRK